MNVACLFCLLDPLGDTTAANVPESAPVHMVSEHDYPLCEDHAFIHGDRTLREFSAFIDEAQSSSYVEEGVACPVCGAVFKSGNEHTGPCPNCDWASPRPTMEWRLAWIARLQKGADTAADQ